MARHNWPPDEEILAGVTQYGEYSSPNIAHKAAYARALGVSATALKDHCARRGITPPGASQRLTAVSPEVGAPVSREEMLEQENTELKRQIANLRSEDVKEQRVIEAIVANLEAKRPLYRPVPRRPAHHAKHEFVLLWSDAHAGEIVSDDETNGANRYDWDVMMARHQELLRAVLSYKESRGYPVGRLHVLALGDMLSGDIHEELRETNSVPLEEATVQFGLDAADWLEEFVPEFPEIRFAGVVGNHPRKSRKPAAKRKFNNSDWTCYQIMRQRLRRVESIRFEIPKAQKHPVDVLGRRILMFHGDTVGPSAMVGVPTGGIVRHVGRLRNQYATMGLPVDHFVCGHFHEVNLYGGKRTIINGSIKGPDEYGLDKFGEASPPMQILLTFNERHGLTDVSYLDCEAGLAGRPALRLAA